MAGKLRRFSFEQLSRYQGLVLLTVLAFAALSFAGSALVGLGEVWQALRQVSPLVLLGVVALGLATYGLRGVRWLMFNQQLKCQVPARQVLLYYLCGSALLTTPGKVGTAIRIFFLRKNHGVPLRTGSAMLMLETISDLVALLFIVALGVAAFGINVGWALVPLMSGVSGGLVLLRFQGVLRFGIKTVYALLNKPRPRLFAGVLQLLRRLRTLLRWRAFGLHTLIGAAGFALSGLTVPLLAADMGSPVPVLTAVAIYGAALLVGAMSFMPGGLGSTEAVMIALLTAAGMPLATAVAVTLVCRMATLWAVVACGFATLPLALRQKPQTAKVEA